MLLKTLIILVVSAVAIAGCGRRGGLEPPGAPAEVAAPDMIAVPAGAPEEDLVPEPGATPGEDTRSPGSLEPAPIAPADAPQRRFFLDPLI